MHICELSLFDHASTWLSLSHSISLFHFLFQYLSGVCIFTNLCVSPFLPSSHPISLSHSLSHTRSLYESMYKCEYLFPFQTLAPSLLLRLCLFLIAVLTSSSFRYAHSVSYFPGLVFEFTAAVCAVSAMVVLFVRTQIIAGRGSQPYTAISGHCVKWAIGMKNQFCGFCTFSFWKHRDNGNDHETKWCDDQISCEWCD